MRKDVVYYIVFAAMIFTATMMNSCVTDEGDINNDSFPIILDGTILDGTLDGLDGYAIRAIAFDSKGNAWIGAFKKANPENEKTQDCIIRYNGQETEIYNSENSIFDIAVDKNDNVWIGEIGRASCRERV